MQSTPMDARFRALHHQYQALLLANVWDAGSARLIEQCGASAIATTSAGVAWSLGYQDGNQLPLDLHVEAIRRIARVIHVPLSVDVEGCYGKTGAYVAARLIDAGAVGLNIEDGTEAPEILCKKIAEARDMAQRMGVDLYINARTDVYARALVAPDQLRAEVLARAHLYREAGADGLFVLGLTDQDDIRAIAQSSGLLLNVVAYPNLPALETLSVLGVRRLSAGSLMPQTNWQITQRLASNFLKDGQSAPLLDGAAPYAEVNASYV
ncbi:isocitrate lyase/PEP mutase family protein [Undibacterium parvum]|uniref:Isocitrate lyase/phosphoenolpyruvate mutase family protein n=2 Tax=Undibacterium TaxID=401469 RepID=A0A6M4A269_9BURK|nr:isocitrate lyase/phosphoenolpyruvate mutase family protein [Undibacterium parvum]AZP10880.1 isocitrate lyase/phosphoenolpyruvate mutase family protein [Undibacterium parvum]QJQ05456.1 isocitrate lyase/phosphoenolpyruvate mutase family protein [Undibacterium piscinae]